MAPVSCAGYSSQVPGRQEYSYEDQSLDPCCSRVLDDHRVGFKMFDIAPKGDIVLYGDSKDHTGTDYGVEPDASGFPKATAAVKRPKNGASKGLLADDEGVWLFGNGYPIDEFRRYRFRFERIALE